MKVICSMYNYKNNSLIFALSKKHPPTNKSIREWKQIFQKCVILSEYFVKIIKWTLILMTTPSPDYIPLEYLLLFVLTVTVLCGQTLCHVPDTIPGLLQTPDIPLLLGPQTSQHSCPVQKP